MGQAWVKLKQCKCKGTSKNVGAEEGIHRKYVGDYSITEHVKAY